MSAWVTAVSGVGTPALGFGVSVGLTSPAFAAVVTVAPAAASSGRVWIQYRAPTALSSIATHPIAMTSSRRSSFLVCVDCVLVVMTFSVAWLRTRATAVRPCGGRARATLIATGGPDVDRRHDAHLTRAGRATTRGGPRIPAGPRDALPLALRSSAPGISAGSAARANGSDARG